MSPRTTCMEVGAHAEVIDVPRNDDGMPWRDCAGKKRSQTRGYLTT